MEARPVELMAPAGGVEAGLAALLAGADAIYLGLRKFSARADADNFGPAELDSIVGFAHSLAPRRRVFVAVNTLVLQRELAEVIDTLGTIADIGADAVIVQDLGVADIARRHFPELRLHASTQLAVHDRAGVETLRRLGFARATLARELTLQEVKEAASVPDIEVETFIHGALCYSYSGLCLFSSQLIGRSGNRGQCAYPCRDAWEAPDAPTRLADGRAPARDPRSGFAFSMKDLALGDQIDGLVEAGVKSLKIEGRKKSPLYVAATVGYYRRLLDGGMTPREREQCEQDLQTIFARPWTSLYLRSQRDKDVADPDHVGHRGAPVGTVEAVVRAGPEVRVRFLTARALGLHDGLQIALPGLGRPFGFAVDRLVVVGATAGNGRQRGGGGGRSVVEAPAGSTVEVALPDDYPTIAVGAPIYCSSSQQVKKQYAPRPVNLRGHRSRRPVDVEIAVEATRLTARAKASAAVRGAGGSGGAAGGMLEAEAHVEGDFGPAQDIARVEAAARGAIEKLGETRFVVGAVRVVNPEARFIPVSKLNELRRDVLAALETRIAEAARERVERVRAEVLAPRGGGEGDAAAVVGAERASREWSIKVDRVAHLDRFEGADFDGVAEIVVDIARDGIDSLESGLAALAGRVGEARVRLALPAIVRRWESAALERKIERLHARGFKAWEASNLSAWTRLGVAPEAPSAASSLAAAAELSLAADWPLYTMNAAAGRALRAWGAERVTLSPEDGLQNLAELVREIGGECATVVVYQDTPLFISESCAYANLAGGCPGRVQCPFVTMELTSDHGPKVLAVDDRCRTVVIGMEPYCVAGAIEAMRAAGVRRVRADFVWRPYRPEEVVERWRQLRRGERVRGHIGNLRRGVG